MTPRPFVDDVGPGDIESFGYFGRPYEILDVDLASHCRDARGS